MSQPYSVTDQLYLWYLGQPAQPRLVGELNLVLSGRGVSLRYAPDWLERGFPLSEDLPLLDMEHLPRSKDVAAGAVDDARPDRWGERVIRLLERPPRLSVLEMLYFAGDSRFGALGVSTSATAYQPHRCPALPTLADVNAVHQLVQQVLNGQQIEEAQRRLIAPGATMGGARPKAVVQIDGAEWVLKFAEERHSYEPLVEHAAMTLAAQAGITVAETRPIPLQHGFAVAVKRFDRLESVTSMPALRCHALSANVALQAAGVALSYPNLAQLLRRRGVLENNLYQTQMHELFRRMVFNILLDNTDDHEKNHVLLVTDAHQYALAPAFDVLPTGQALGYQALEVGTKGAVSSLENALSMCRAFGLTPAAARAEIARVIAVVNSWQAHFAACGVPAPVIGQLVAQIDRPYLLQQRQVQ